MLKILVERWDRNKPLLVETLKEIENIDDIEYKDLVKITFSTIFNGQKPDVNSFCRDYKDLDVNSITEINNGSYSGTLVYLIPFDSYSPSPDEYLMTYVYYGSCSGCDTLQGIKYDSDSDGDKEKQVSELVSLCKDIITNTIKPYNHGWRHADEFDHVEVEVEDE